MAFGTVHPSAGPSAPPGAVPVVAPTIPLSQDSKQPPAMALQLTVNTPVLYQVPLTSAAAASVPPLNLAAAYVQRFIDLDNTAPALYATPSGDRYNFINQKVPAATEYPPGTVQPSPQQTPLPQPSRFTKTRLVPLPSQLYEDYNASEVYTKMGLFPQLLRAWVIVDNKLHLWSYSQIPSTALLSMAPSGLLLLGISAPLLSGSTSPAITTIDDIHHVILAAEVVKPKPKVFVDDVTHLLLLATPHDVHIFLLKYKPLTNALEIFNPDMAVPTQGLGINHLVAHPTTNTVYMCGESDGINVWRLEYSNKEDWFNLKCSKTCLTRTGFGGMVLPGQSGNSGPSFWSKIPGMGLFLGGDELGSGLPRESASQPSATPNTPAAAGPAPVAAPSSSVETVIQVEIDPTRNILYTLSLRSVVRAYCLLDDGRLGASQTLAPRTMINDLSTTLGNIYELEALQPQRFKVVAIHAIGKHERGNLFLMATTNYGVRVFVNGLLYRLAFYLGQLLGSQTLTLKTAGAKFPPSKFYLPPPEPRLDDELEGIGAAAAASTAEQEYANKVAYHQQRLTLLKNTKQAAVYAPGCFVAVRATKNYDKLFVLVPQYGHLKSANQWVEDCEFVIDSGELGQGGFINDIVRVHPFTVPTAAAPRGSANVYATQYLSDPLEFAVLTNGGIQFFQYRTPDVLLQQALMPGATGGQVVAKGALQHDDRVFREFVDQNGLEETCNSLLYLLCKLVSHNDFDGRATELFKQQVLYLFSVCGKGARTVLGRTPGLQFPLVEAAGAANGTASAPVQSQAPPQLAHRLLMLSVASDAASLSTVAVAANAVNAAAPQSADPTSPSIMLSDRFYGTVLLVLRLFRTLWHSKVFSPVEHLKFTPNGGVIVLLIKDDGVVVKNLHVTKDQLEFYIGLVVVMLEYFEQYGHTVPGMHVPTVVGDPYNTQQEVAMRTEHLALVAMRRLLQQMKEGLLFLMMLAEETRNNLPQPFQEIVKFLSQANQVNLLQLTFHDFVAPTNSEVKNLVKDLLLAILNKNILKGGLIDMIATLLQERCGLFCSASDVVIFKAIENLTRAAKVGPRDPELRRKHLLQAVQLFEQCASALTLENIENSLNIMMELDYFAGAVRFLLSVADRREHAATANKDKAATPAVAVVPASPQSTQPTPQTSLYRLVFRVLSAADSRVQQSLGPSKDLRDEAYATAFKHPNESFQYAFYDWLAEQGRLARFVDVDSQYMLLYLQQRLVDSVATAELLWMYYAKRQRYFDAARVLYSLAVLEFVEVGLTQRIEYLSRATGFANCVCPPHLRQQVVQLGRVLEELADVALVQLDVLTTVEHDPRLQDPAVRQEAILHLNLKVLGVSDLFNLYVDPLGYYDLALVIFKVSDHRDPEDIVLRWQLFVDKISGDYDAAPEPKEPFHAYFTPFVVELGRQVSDNETVFPLGTLVPMFVKQVFHTHALLLAPPPVGCVVEMFVAAGVSFDKVYYQLRDAIEDGAPEVFPGYLGVLKREMAHLIKRWVATDKSLRSLLNDKKVAELLEYLVDTDPLHQFVSVG